MSAKAEIGWRRLDAEGDSCQVYAQRVGGAWRFFQRRKRYDEWRPMPSPPLEDWLQLLEAVERRLQRRRWPPAEAARIRRRILELFPAVSWDP